MYQGIGIDLAQTVAEVNYSGYLSGTCTIQVPTGAQNADGSPANTWVAVSELTGLYCQIAVPSATAVQATEVKDLEEIMARSIRHVLLAGFYPQLKQLKQAGQVQALLSLTGDSTYTFEVLGAEDDSQGQMTRFECQWVSL